MEFPRLATPSPCAVLRSRPEEREKTIVITGVARGGTTFGAAIVGRLGIPFCGTSEQGAFVGRRYSHLGLANARAAGDATAFAAICRDLDRQHSVWAMKDVELNRDLAALSSLRNPHYIIILKEPLSVAMRSVSLKRRDGPPTMIGTHTRMIFKRYAALLEFATRNEAPVLLLSYDRGIRDPDRAVDAVASFIGVTKYDRDAVLAGIDTDRDKYFEAGTISTLRHSSSWPQRAIGSLLAHSLSLVQKWEKR